MFAGRVLLGIDYLTTSFGISKADGKGHVGVIFFHLGTGLSGRCLSNGREGNSSLLWQWTHYMVTTQEESDAFPRVVEHPASA